MNTRPLSVTLIAWLFIAAGAVGLVYHAGDFRALPPLSFALVCFVRLLAVLGGVFLLRGQNWARWLVLGWLAYHVALSALHSAAGVAMHAALLALIGYFLLRPRASAWFRAAR